MEPACGGPGYTVAALGADEFNLTTHFVHAKLPVETALDQLISALQLFQQSTTLQPHFAYGNLSQNDFMAAHQLHIEQHLSQIGVA